MKSPLTNSENYFISSVHNTSGFQHARGGVLLQHGTGDDNVHFQNSAVLVDLLMSGGANGQAMSIAEFDSPKHGIQFGPYAEEVKAESSFGSASAVSPSKLHVQWFTDSDHGISFHGASIFIRKQMARWLYKEKHRKESTHAEKVHQWDL
jgi:dipeptidyl-peptidase 4